MKKFLLLSVSLLFWFSLSSQVAVNNDGSAADGYAMLDIQATDAGVLVPRMTSNERDAISGPATGLLVYVTTDNAFYFYSGSSWIRINTLQADDPTQPIPLNFREKFYMYTQLIIVTA